MNWPSTRRPRARPPLTTAPLRRRLVRLWLAGTGLLAVTSCAELRPSDLPSGPAPGPPRPEPTEVAREEEPRGELARRENVIAGDPLPRSSSPPQITAADCGKDQWFETVCGSVEPTIPLAQCGATGDSLIAYGKSQLPVTQGSWMSHDPTFKDFFFDGAAASAYRQSLGKEGTFHLDRYCCYSRCTRLAVAKAAPRVRVPPRHRLGHTCVPPSPAGTVAPSIALPSCAAALEREGAMRPLDPAVSSATSCCYAVAAPFEIEAPPRR